MVKQKGKGLSLLVSPKQCVTKPSKHGSNQIHAEFTKSDKMQLKTEPKTQKAITIDIKQMQIKT